ncbi:MAG: PRC-barrel domain-containing protein [Iamia sp.]
MAQAEHIDDWKGLDVVDRDGEKVGKLEETYSELGQRDPVIGAVKTGRLTHKVHLVPLTDATVGRDHIRVPLSEDEVDAAPTVGASGQMTREEETAFLRHFEIDEPDGADDDRTPRYESSAVATKRRAALDEDLERADEVEAEADEVAARAEETEREAAEADKKARADRDEEERLRREAEETRSRVQASRPPE